MQEPDIKQPRHSGSKLCLSPNFWSMAGSAEWFSGSIQHETTKLNWAWPGAQKLCRFSCGVIAICSLSTSTGNDKMDTTQVSSNPSWGLFLPLMLPKHWRMRGAKGRPGDILWYGTFPISYLSFPRVILSWWKPLPSHKFTFPVHFKLTQSKGTMQSIFKLLLNCELFWAVPGKAVLWKLILYCSKVVRILKNKNIKSSP